MLQDILTFKETFEKSGIIIDMKYLFVAVIAISLLAVGCNNTKIQGEIPTSPQASYEELPR